jgi:hypothetical protein
MSGGFESFKRRIGRLEESAGIDPAIQANAKVEPCEVCGRRAGQIGILDHSSMRDIGPKQTPGCESCADGLPGEIPLGPVRMIRIVDAPTREEIGNWR